MPKEDIVLALYSREKRKLTEFAETDFWKIRFMAKSDSRLNGMVVSEVINSKMQSLPVSAQSEVLHFVEFLSQKYEQHESEDQQWSEFSLDQAMEGLKDKTPYNEEDLQEKWR